jgi:prepilin-type N-terminal cleavage/methylation domain-containing protein
MFYCSNTTYTHKKAFGLVELMVSMSIMALMATVMVARQSSFNGAVLLRNQAYEVAYTLRQAQLLAVSGNETDIRQYGVHFDTSTANETTYILFADVDNDGRFDVTDDKKIGLTGRLDSRFEVREVTPSTNNGDFLDVIFIRPNFDALFCVRLSGCNNSGQFTAGPAYIDVARKGETGDGTGQVRRVQVSATGQISVVTY